MEIQRAFCRTCELYLSVKELVSIWKGFCVPGFTENFWQIASKNSVLKQEIDLLGNKKEGLFTCE